MIFRNKKNIQQNLNKIIELKPSDADAIIASGASVPIPGQTQEYIWGRNCQMQSLLKKLHGK